MPANCVSPGSNFIRPLVRLEMVGMEAPAKVLRAMEALAQRFVQRPELCSDDAANKVERASFALTEYLEGVLKGKAASVGRLVSSV
jgi:hypothetical protein